MKNMRQRPRVEINHLVSFTCHDGNDHYSPSCDGMLINISTKGALIESQSPMNDKFLVLGNKSKTNPRLVKGEIVYTDTVISAEGSVYGMYRTGIKFTDLHENSKKFVVSIVTPEAANTTNVVNNETDQSTSLFPDFDTNAINKILEDETPTEDLLRLDELFEDENSNDTGYDVLDNIAEVLEESSRPKAEMLKTLVQPNDHSDENQQPISNKKSHTSRFLFFFNAACFFTIFLMITAAVLFHKARLSSSDEPGIQLPFFSKTKPLKLNNIEAFKPKKTAAVSLINNSIKNRFVKNSESGVSFIVSGLIQTYSLTSPDNIKITGRIFNENNFLLGKTYGTFENTDEGSKTIPFLVSFSDPPANISRFSVDIGI